MSNSQMSYRAEVPAALEDQVLTIEVFDYIDGNGGPWGISAREVIQAIGTAGELERIDVNIHSGGGDVFEALAIYNRLRSHPAPVHVRIDGLAASAASLIAMAGDVIEMPINAWMMVHQPWTVAMGNASDFRDQADFLDRNTDMLVGIYTERSGQPEDQVRAWVTDETWFDGDQALAAGLIDNTTKHSKIAASADLTAFSKAPAAAARIFSPPPQDSKPMSNSQDAPKTPTLADLRAACPGADSDFILDQAEKGATLQAAQSSHIETLTAKLENRETEILELKASHKAELEARDEKHENDIEGIKVEHGAETLALREYRDAADEKVKDAEAKLAQVQAGVGPDDVPASADATDPNHRSQTSAFSQAVRLNRN